MALVYEQCGNCRRKGAYVVADRDVVRCKYCAASEQWQRLDPSNLGAVAAGLHAVEETKPVRARVPSLRPGTHDQSRIGGGVISMEIVRLDLLVGPDDMAIKPFVPADLLSRVEAVIAGRSPRPAASSTA